METLLLCGNHGHIFFWVQRTPYFIVQSEKTSIFISRKYTEKDRIYRYSPLPSINVLNLSTGRSASSQIAWTCLMLPGTQISPTLLRLSHTSRDVVWQRFKDTSFSYCVVMSHQHTGDARWSEGVNGSDHLSLGNWSLTLFLNKDQ